MFTCGLAAARRFCSVASGSGTIKLGHAGISKYEIVTPQALVPVKRVFPDQIGKPHYADSGVVGPCPSQVKIKSDEEVELIRAACKIARKILDKIGEWIRPGVSGQDIDDFVYQMAIDHHCYPSPLNYNGFPKSVTTSVNNIAVHGIPDARKLVNGDIITVDVSIFLNNYHGDCAHTYLIGECDDDVRHLKNVAQLCLMEAIKICRDGQPLNLVGETIEQVARENKLKVLPTFCGHGVGRHLHEKPQILHYKHRSDEVMQQNMVFTIEPVLTEGSSVDVIIEEDGWTVTTQDNSRTAQFEHTICVRKDGAEILTRTEETEQSS